MIEQRTWRWIGWGAAAAALALPALAMPFVPGMNWGAEDFVTMAILLGVTGLAIEWLVRARGGTAYRIAAVAGPLALMLAVWAILAVGPLGS